MDVPGPSERADALRHKRQGALAGVLRALALTLTLTLTLAPALTLALTLTLILTLTLTLTLTRCSTGMCTTATVSRK